MFSFYLNIYMYNIFFTLIYRFKIFFVLLENFFLKNINNAKKNYECSNIRYFLFEKNIMVKYTVKNKNLTFDDLGEDNVNKIFKNNKC